MPPRADKLVVNLYFTLFPIKRGSEAKFAAISLLKRPRFPSLHVEKTPLLKISTIFQKNVAPTQTSLKRSVGLFSVWCVAHVNESNGSAKKTLEKVEKITK